MTRCGHHLVLALGDAGQQVAGEVDAAPLVRRPLETTPDGVHQSGVLVRNDQLHAGEPPGAQGPQEAPPKDLVFGVADVEAQDLSVPVGVHAGGDDDGLGGHVVVVADMEVGGVQEDVGELLVVETPGPKGPHHLVETSTDAADLGLLDPAADAQGSDELVDRAGGDPAHVGLHDHRVQRLVDAPAGLEDGGEEAALPQLGDGELDVAGLGRHQADPVPVALGHAVFASFVALRPDQGARLGLDQLLEDVAHGVADQIHAIGRFECLQQLSADRLVKGHRGALLGAFGQEHTENHPGGTTYRWMPRLKSKAHHSEGRTPPPGCGSRHGGTSSSGKAGREPDSGHRMPTTISPS